jgi:hypothetical protein
MGDVNMSKRTQMTIGLVAASASLLISIISLIKTCTYSSSDFDAGKLVWQFANQILVIILLVIYIISVWKKKTSFAWTTFFGICLLQTSNLLLTLSIIVPIYGSIGIALANMKLQFMLGWLALFLGCLVIGVRGTIAESETREIATPAESSDSMQPKPYQVHTSLGIEREQIPEQQKESSTSKQQGSLPTKILKSIVVVLLIFACLILAIALTGEDNEQMFVKIAAFLILVSIGVIWKSKKLTNEDETKEAKNELEKNCQPKSEKVSINCPRCGRSLKGATQEMIGDTGICPKCKTEFVIEQKQ